ncbi:MAG: hypothetical protein AB1942_14210 [Pseudomonadota bacterium]
MHDDVSFAGSRVRIRAGDDHAILREGLAALIEGRPDRDLAAKAAKGAEAIGPHQRHSPHITLSTWRGVT